jgi:hypothetical protein
MSGLELHDDEPTIFLSEPNIDISNRHQVYAILEETLEELDPYGNPYVNPLNLRGGSKYAREGETKAIVVAREKVQLTAAEWVTIRAAINDTTTKPSDAPRNILMGYQYALHRQGRHVLHKREIIEAHRASASAVSRALGEERNSASYTNNERRRRLIRLQRIYNFLCSMLVYAPFALCFVTLRVIFMHFPELTY